jgi:hypothetical protein
MLSISTHLVNTTAAVAIARHRAVSAWCTGGFEGSYSFMPNTKPLRPREPSLV